MGCGKSKHDVVTGNTTKIRKPTEAESVKGKESETLRRQGSCRCRKTNDISAVASGDPPETTVENNAMKPEEKEPTISPPENVVSEEKETTISPPVTAILPESVVTEEKETTISPPVAAIVPENVVTEEPVNESGSPVHEQKEKIDIETVVEEEKSVEGKSDDDDGDAIDTEVPLDEVEEPKSSEEQTPVTTELEVEEENDENVATKNDETQVLKDENKVDVDVGEENQADKTKEAESA